jgi:DNA-binding beta-propeller fold protein YncE
MLRHISIIALSAALAAYAFSSCRHEPFNPEVGNFPADVSRIMISKCATTGCHDAAGAVNAARLRLDSWDELFKGSSHGAVVVPYAATFSSLLYYLNDSNFSNNDPVAYPTMPYNQSPLTEEEYNIIKNWIANGAPDADGNIAFASDADTRQKVYVTQQGCEDLLTVIDAKTGLVMRYVPVGATNLPERAHHVKVAQDGRYAYVCYYSGTKLHKIDTRTDQIVGVAEIGNGNWNVMNITPDGSKLIVSGLESGMLTIINTGTMNVINTYEGIFTQPHGIASTPNFDTFYITSQYGNVVYRFIPDDQVEPLHEIVIKGTDATFTRIVGVTPDPHDIMMSSDNSRLFVTCQETAEVRVIDVATEQITALSVGAYPQELAICKKKNLMFVSCQEDPTNTYSTKSKGSVYAINMSTLQVSAPIYGDLFQPHGIVVDERNDLIYVASRNIDVSGPAPHHTSTCDGRNGWYSIYDLNSLQQLNKIRYEVTPEPYGSDIRFK